MGPGGVEKEKRNTFNYLYQDNILHKENQPQSNIDTSGTCLFKVQTMEIVFFFVFFSHKVCSTWSRPKFLDHIQQG